jgi:hypothetical protein
VCPALVILPSYPEEDLPVGFAEPFNDPLFDKLRVLFEDGP